MLLTKKTTRKQHRIEEHLPQSWTTAETENIERWNMDLEGGTGTKNGNISSKETVKTQKTKKNKIIQLKLQPSPVCLVSVSNSIESPRSRFQVFDSKKHEGATGFELESYGRAERTVWKMPHCGSKLQRRVLSNAV